MKPGSELSRELKKSATRLGFDLFGIAGVDILEEDRLRHLEWIRNGYHAGMDYMARNIEKRFNPTELLDGARSVIVVGMNHYQPYEPREGAPRFARYALGNDYHQVMKERMSGLTELLKRYDPEARSRAFTDSAPVKENLLAARAGLGWIGKNSLLINKDYGSWFFIGEIITTQELEHNEVQTEDHCGTCRRCIESCPTGAILENRTLDARRCISWLTIENRGETDPSIAGKTGDRVFGCDRCQEVCPWNRRAKRTKAREFEPTSEIIDYTTSQWLSISEEEFRRITTGSPVSRTGYPGFMRNLAIVEANQSGKS